MLEIETVLSERGERQRALLVREGPAELETSERVADVLGHNQPVEHFSVAIDIFVKRGVRAANASHINVADAQTRASRPRQPGHVAPSCAHLPNRK